jgi:hypothetical protein
MIMGFFNLFHVNPHMCGGHDGQSFEMTLMWFAMSIAHCKPWLDYID